MKISRNGVIDFGKIQSLLEVSVIGMNETFHIMHMNAYARKLLDLKDNNSFMGKSIIKLFEALQLPPIINSNGTIIATDLMLNNDYLQKWEKITLDVDNETWSLLIGYSPTGKEKLEQKNTVEKDHIYLNSIIENLPQLVYWKDDNYRYQGCNKHVAELLNLNTPEEIIGKTDYDFGWTEERIKGLQDVDVAIIQQGINSIVEDAIPVNGDTKIFLTSKTSLHDKNGKIIGILGISTDITERKKIEEDLKFAKEAAEMANKAKTEFLENMRHDIRTPLSGIVGFSELLKSESKEPLIKEYADNLMASSHALLNLMDEVLEAVRVSSGEIPMLKRKFNLAQLFEQVIALYLAKAHEKHLKLSLNLDKKLPHFVIGDKIRLHRIALELVGNALNFTDKGHVTIDVTLAKRKNRNLVIQIKVTDSGMGIPKEKQQEIYVQFKRLTPSYQGIYKGTGLGLYVVKQFIEELDGEIYVESEPYKGSCFTCLIPLKEALLDNAFGIDHADNLNVDKSYLLPLTQQELVEKVNVNQPAVANVLVVEDNIISQSVAKTILSAMTCRVDIASNGCEALGFCKKNHYDLIFMDIGLGEGMDGYDVTHHIRSQHPGMKHTPIIALTAHAADENKQRCMKAGMDAVLTKPLTQSHAVDILRRFVLAKDVPLPAIKTGRRDLPDSNEELFHLEQFALFDEEQGLKNCGDRGMLMELLTIMSVTQIPEDLERLKQAFKTQDYSLVEQMAHKIKGSAVYVGTTRLKYACQYVERYWKTGERDLFDKLYHQAIHTIEETCKAISDWLKKNKMSVLG